MQQPRWPTEKPNTKTQIETDRYENKRHKHRHRQNTETKREKNTDKTYWTRVIDEFTRVTDNKDDRRIHRKVCIFGNKKITQVTHTQRL